MDQSHPAAGDHLPSFIAAPGQTDVLFVITTILLIAAVLGIGVLYLRLHALPEQIAHRTRKVQMEIVAVLALLALFTHNHLFWIAGLILAFVELPDFSTPMRSMARSLAKLAGREEPVIAMTAPQRPSETPAVESGQEAELGEKPPADNRPVQVQP
jgi:hypothetical protein